eukprot:SAG11_NODE_13527_length_651_cov_0.873188_2_plen_42_part_01
MHLQAVQPRPSIFQDGILRIVLERIVLMDDMTIAMESSKIIF